MFERFTDHARRAVMLAQREARELRHVNVGTEDLIIGIMQIEEDIPARALANLGVPLETARKNVEEMHFSAATWRPHGDVSFTEAAKKSLELALREALQLGHNYIGTEHLLLGIIRHDSDTANKVLNVYPGTVRQAIVKLVMERDRQTAQETTPPKDPPVRSSDDIAIEIETLEERLRVLKAEHDAAVKHETGCHPSYHH